MSLREDKATVKIINCMRWTFCEGLDQSWFNIICRNGLGNF